jgi:hypothetical protein
LLETGNLGDKTGNLDDESSLCWVRIEESVERKVHGSKKNSGERVHGVL